MVFGLNRQIIPLVGISLLAHVTLSGGRVASSLYVLQNGNSEVIAGLTYGLYGLMPALLAVFIGRLVDIAGPRLIMRVCLLAMVTGLILPALHLSLFTILLCAALGGLGFGGYILAAHVAVSLVEVERASDRTSMYAWQQMGMSVSAVTGPTFVGTLIDTQGYSVAYFCLTGLVLAGFLWALGADLPKGGGAMRKEKRTSILSDVLADRALLRIYLLSMSVYLAWDAFSFMIPVLGTAHGFPAATIGLILSFFAAGTFLVRAIQPWVSRKSTELRTLNVSFAASALVFTALAMTHNLMLLCVISLVFGLAAGVGHPNILKLLLEKVDPAKSGQASGLRLMTGNFAGMVGTAACGAGVALVGMWPVFLIIAGIMGVSSWRTRPSAD